MTVAERLATHYRSIAGIKLATHLFPRVLLAASLPQVIVFYGPGSIELQGSGLALEQRDYRAVLFVEVAQFGGQHQAFNAALPFLERVRDYFLARPQLDVDQGDDVSLNHRFLGDSGITITGYPASATEDAQFVAVTFNHRVQRLIGFEYQD
jgi:hypothetical protein